MKKLIKVSALLGMLVTSVNLNTYGEELNRHCLNSDLEETIQRLVNISEVLSHFVIRLKEFLMRNITG